MKKPAPSLPDHELWDQVKRTIRPLKLKAKPTPRDTHHSGSTPIRRRSDSGVALHNPPALGQFDRRQLQKLARTEDPESRIDLHGETLETARVKLHNYLQSAHAQGRRLVLVITGKGGDSLHSRTGRLRREVPFWLEEAMFRQHVSAFQQAHQRHGGGGALYVKLRRIR